MPVAALAKNHQYSVSSNGSHFLIVFQREAGCRSWNQGRRGRLLLLQNLHFIAMDGMYAGFAGAKTGPPSMAVVCRERAGVRSGVFNYMTFFSNAIDADGEKHVTRN